MELNKIASSILLSALVIMVISNIVDMFYNPVKHDVAYKPLVSAISNDAVQGKLEQVILDTEKLMQNANFEKGKLISKKCIACHSFEKRGPNKVGPNLWNIVGDKKGRLANGFNYSKALHEKGGTWGHEELFSFLKNPQVYIKGTRMSFAGITNPKDIADLISYLETMRDK